MKRIVWMTCVGLTLASFSGCHLCKKKHLRQASLIDGGSCECGPAIPSSYEGIPTAEPGVMVAPAPIPYSGPLPALRRNRDCFAHSIVIGDWSRQPQFH